MPQTAKMKDENNKMMINNRKHCSRLKHFYQSCRQYLHCSNTTTSTDPQHRRSTDNPTEFHNPIPRLPPLQASYSLKTNRNNGTISSHRRASSSSNTMNGVGEKDDEEENVNAAITEEYWRRACKLEQELKKLEDWLDTEMQKRGSGRRNHISFEGDVFTTQQPRQEEGGNRSSATRNEVKNEIVIIRLGDGGGYLHVLDHYNKGVEEGGRLALHFSVPAVLSAETGSGISQILDQMSTMGTDKLLNWLLDSMPLPTIMSPEQTQPTGEIITHPARDDVMESILMGAINKIESLAVKGIQIQIGGKRLKMKDYFRYYNDDDTSIKGKVIADDDGEPNAEESFITTVLVQPVDPCRRYKSIGEPMVGLVEVVVKDGGEESVGLHIHGVHLAGLSVPNGNGTTDCLWCIS